MAVVIKFIKGVRNHWKKSTAAALLIAYGSNLLKNKYEASQIMRAYCEEAKKYGDVALPVGKQPRHVTVLLNPASKDGKGEALFEKYSSPLLHLAGIRVSLVKTEHEGQARSLMEVMDNTDAVLVAGGDGLLSEAVTGLFRRQDGEKVAQSVPLGIIPIGKTNTLAKSLFSNEKSSEVKLLAASTMAVIREVVKPIDVMAFEQGESDSRPVYALARMDWGIFRDTELLIPKYWYWAGLKQRMAYVFASIKSWPETISAELEYSLPCAGCSSCYLTKKVMETPIVTERNPRWWSSFVPKAKPTEQDKKYHREFSKISNPECGQKHRLELSTRQLEITTANTIDGCQAGTDYGMNMTMYSSQMSWWQFLTEGWRRVGIRGPIPEVDKSHLNVGEVKILPRLPDGIENWYSIDNEAFETRAVTVRLLPERLKVYCRNSTDKNH